MGAGAFIVSITGRVAAFLRPTHCRDERNFGDLANLPNQFVAHESRATGAAESLPLGGAQSFAYAHAIGCECAECWLPVPSFHNPKDAR